MLTEAVSSSIMTIDHAVLSLELVVFFFCWMLSPGEKGSWAVLTSNLLE